MQLYGGKVYAFGAIGTDQIGTEIINELVKYKINIANVFTTNKIHSIFKQRIIAGTQQLLRIDNEIIKQLSNTLQIKIFSNLEKLVKQKKIQAIILSDYGKGIFLSETFTQKIIDLANENNIITVYDPNKNNKINVKNTTIMKPNKNQALALANSNNKNLNEIAKIIQEKYHNKYLIISLSQNGMNIYDEKIKCTKIPTLAKEIADVSGAGDSLIATITLAFLSCNNIYTAAKIANAAAGIVISKLGTATVSKTELLNF